MNRPPTDDLIARLVADARPVRPLGSPARRALSTLGVILAAGIIAAAFTNRSPLLLRYAGHEGWLLPEMAAVLITGLLAVTGAFFGSVPGRSRLWFSAPLPFFFAWVAMSAAGSYDNLVATADRTWRLGESWHCLLFITGISLVVSVPLALRLARARPVRPVPVALSAGLGSAALSTFLLHFFHPFDVTATDVAVHVAAILLVTATMVAFRRTALRPA